MKGGGGGGGEERDIKVIRHSSYTDQGLLDYPSTKSRPPPLPAPSPPSRSALSNFALFLIYGRGIVTKLGRGHLRYYRYYPGQHLAVRKPAKDLNPILSDCADVDLFPLAANKEDNKAEREAVLSTKKKQLNFCSLLRQLFASGRKKKYRRGK